MTISMHYEMHYIAMVYSREHNNSIMGLKILFFLPEIKVTFLGRFLDSVATNISSGKSVTKAQLYLIIICNHFNMLK